MRKLFSLRLNRFLGASVTGLVALLRLTPSFPIAPVVLASCSVLVAVAPLGAATVDAKRSFDLPSGDAATTLRQFAAAAGKSLVFVTDKVRGETTNSVRGEFTPRDALERMLTGSALEAAQDAATGALVVSRKRTAEVTPPAKMDERASVFAPQSKPKTMSPRSRSLLAVFAALIGGETFAQTAPATNPPPQQEIVVLSPFSVSGARSSRYQPTQSVSSGRIATAIIDTAQSVSVIPREFIEDAGTSRIFDAVKYLSGVSESTLPGAIDRITLRGFQTDNGFIDNFNFSLQANNDPVIVERIEVVKGPNSILSPSGPGGGTINLVTKSPLFQRSDTVKLQLGQYDANRVEGDSTGPLGDGSKFAYRMLFAYEDSASYHDNTFTKSLVLMPMWRWRISQVAELTVKYLYMDWERTPYLGIPVDPSSGSDNDAVLLAGVPRTRSMQEKEQSRLEIRNQVFTNLEMKFSDNFSGRLSVNGVYGRGRNQQLVTGTNTNTFGNTDPRTGKWVKGVSFLQVAPFTSTPLPPPSRTYIRTGVLALPTDRRYNLQNIYVLTQDAVYFGSTSVFGFTADLRTARTQQSPSPIAPLDIDKPVYGSRPVVGATNNQQLVTETSANAFLSQQLRFLKDRLFVSASYTRVAAKNDVVNEILQPATTIANRRGDTGLLSWSVMAKVLPNLGLYYADSNNAAPISLTSTPLNSFTFREGNQKEYGVKLTLDEGRTVISAAAFDIGVNNFSFPNPASLGSSNQNIGSIVGDFVSKGWELEFSSAIAKQWTLLGSYSHSKYRDRNGIRQRGTADHSAGLFVRYDFSTTRSQRGLYLTAGFEFLGDRAGDTASGFTAASTSTTVIYNQPTFFLGSRKLLDLGVGYRRERWQIDAYVQNALNEEYISATLNRNLAIAGAPTSVKASFTYRF